MKKKKTFAVLLAAALLAAGGTDAALADHNTFGTYHWGAQPELHYSFESWLGAEQDYVLDFVGDEGWYSIAEPYWLTSVWKETKYKNKLILSIPMLPKLEGVSLESGANGDYDGWFRLLAQHLINMGMEDTVIRIGWEMNGGWYKWAAAGHEADYAVYFANIVTAMRSVEGGNFRFFWNPAIGWLSADTEKCYPGDDYVDYIGLDVYDECWEDDTYPIPEGASEVESLRRRAKAFISLKNRTWGLNWLTDFARAHNKKVIIGEWGTDIRSDSHGGGDNPFFVQWMHDWFVDNEDVIYAHMYFDVTAPDGDHKLSGETTQFPNAALKFKQLWGNAPAEGTEPEEKPAEYIVNENFDAATAGALPSSWKPWMQNGGISEVCEMPGGRYYPAGYTIYKDNDAVFAKTVNAEDGDRILTAVYDADGRLLGLSCDTADNDSYNHFDTSRLIIPEGGEYAKAFIWNDMNPRTVSGCIRTDELTSADKCIRLTGVTGANMEAKAKKEFTAQSGKVTVESMIRVDGTGTLNGPVIGSSGGTTAVAVQIMGDREIIHSPGGVWKSIYPNSAGREYSIKVVIDTDTDTYDLYIDGNKIAENEALQNAVADIAFVSYDFKTAGIAYIDDVRVYKN